MPKYPITSESGIIFIEVSLISKSRKIIPLKMVLDTGATITTVPIEAAIAIGCDPAKSKKRIKMITASGTEYAPVVTIPEVRFLGFKLKDVEVKYHANKAQLDDLLEVQEEITRPERLLLILGEDKQVKTYTQVTGVVETSNLHIDFEIPERFG